MRDPVLLFLCPSLSTLFPRKALLVSARHEGWVGPAFPQILLRRNPSRSRLQKHWANLLEGKPPQFLLALVEAAAALFPQATLAPSPNVVLQLEAARALLSVAAVIEKLA